MKGKKTGQQCISFNKFRFNQAWLIIAGALLKCLQMYSTVFMIRFYVSHFCALLLNDLEIKQLKDEKKKTQSGYENNLVL